MLIFITAILKKTSFYFGIISPSLAKEKQQQCTHEDTTDKDQSRHYSTVYIRLTAKI